MQKYVIKDFERPSRKIIETFKEFDVSTVYEAQGKQGLFHHSIKPVQYGKTICGPAVTVTCPAGDNLMIHAAIEVCKPGDILVVSTIGESVSGMIGELIVRALMYRGVQGLIIEAGIRDLRAIRELEFPVWSKSVYSEGTTKNRGGWVNAPAICGGVEVNPGDIILADDDGVVVVKKEDIDSTLEATQKRIEKEQGTKEKIAKGELSLDFYQLREVLQKENVIYYDHIHDVK
ncbi:4-carboxy-4-hydroxy-2-oxoadipate aldolase/oxaloacetate decarboxylase [Ureibacillus thermophilus]|uniref:Putative 4-hydroxy-4-methyl-2-oxoglutarate aldolase n=1 Tax=Ureibacillus thermophilus TaxID=367743 RepID=A0A4P6UWG9_9BACL|nr:4-carboxy-4-hydroxy-2-oxoadipate aldolase/oxaloacetate decarboxylase [Ureibacillus thermophilus]QBK25972.1 4-carboxy-4-hydroxy-2-oxoadipate aldolase/oxaloacetate decarboxylase [Ureibacillus thermophilus]